MKTAFFAGGCFWCMEQPFDITGVSQVLPGYTGGHTKDPTYEDVCSGTTGHYEAVEVKYDPAVVSFRQLLDIYWKQIDPTDAYGQFADKGGQYQTAIFYNDEEEKRIAEESKKQIEKLTGKTVQTKILPACPFYKAEEYHCRFFEKSPARYNQYKAASGREEYKRRNWGDKDLSNLTPMQYKVTQQGYTEPPFDNEYWDNKTQGIYVDVITGEPLFTSLDKFDSGCGWPSFTKPIKNELVSLKDDISLGKARTEVKTKGTGAHLGHVFDDGPYPLGTRYCINSASLRFIPKGDLKKEGYGEYEKLFEGDGK